MFICSQILKPYQSRNEDYQILIQLVLKVFKFNVSFQVKFQEQFSSTIVKTKKYFLDRKNVKA